MFVSGELEYFTSDILEQDILILRIYFWYREYFLKNIITEWISDKLIEQVVFIYFFFVFQDSIKEPSLLIVINWYICKSVLDESWTFLIFTAHEFSIKS